MEQQGVEQTSQPVLCAAGCGFYSNSGQGGMCSKCSREAQAREAKLKPPTPAPVVAPVPVVPAAAVPQPEQPSNSSCEAPAPASTSAVPTATSAAPGAPKPPSPTRCLVCNKKVGLTGFSCKCTPDAVFCSSHRYAEAHACTFDYKAAQAKHLAENNPVVMASKLNKF